MKRRDLLKGAPGFACMAMTGPSGAQTPLGLTIPDSLLAGADEVIE
jgi:hypothetical protein